MDDVELPEVPTDKDPEDPLDWIKEVGQVKWVTSSRKTKCDDCLRLIYEQLMGIQRFAKPPGAARWAAWERKQGEGRTFHCSPHRHSRISRGDV